MLIRLLLKIWPALLPILFYLFWIFVVEKIIIKKFFKKSKIIEGEFKIVGEGETAQPNNSSIPKFSLQNRVFVMVLYLSFILAIIALVLTAFS